MAPNDLLEKDDPILLSTKDHKFALSGEIMLLVLVLLFTLFLVALIFFLCMKHFNYSCISKLENSPTEQIVPSPYPSTPMSTKPLYRDIKEFDGTRWMP
ncbi:hypothetical protein RND71_003909 [Anisodus tanguticus]|uniref:Uncharacterized protein n=1 Tax=Anisodus tanguticus TaxID=243964 RepID=A0AAE1SXM6_9SOLA|nr:hypothetical protein RND71_003909 [Anisodus tanguticus]